MVIIRRKQVEDLKTSRQLSFESRLGQHLTSLFPHHLKSMSQPELTAVVRFCAGKAAVYGFVTESAVARYSELMCYFGAHFDSDPQAIWARSILDQPGDAGACSTALYEAGMRFWGEIAGPDNTYLRAAMKRLQGDPLPLLRSALEPSPETGLPDTLMRLYPEKAERLGRDLLNGLLQLGRKQAAGHGLTSSPGVVLFTGLMFALGSGFSEDPILPWTQEALKAPAASGERERVSRLLEQAQAFLGRWS
ncbi:MAG: hypothetical protein ACRD7E_16105 [Bryobacteraceae bacterium]